MVNVLKKFRTRLIDAKIRTRAALHETRLDKFRVKIATNIDEYEDAFRLLHMAYVYQGIQDIKSGYMRITPQHVLPETTVFVVYEGDTIAGTMTVTLDSPAGLPLDFDYPDEVRQLRSQGARMVEFGSLAIRQSFKGGGVTNLLTMATFHWAINILHATDLVIGINPAAEAWYRAVYNFELLGSSKTHASLSAPVLGMHCRLDELVDFLNAKHKKPLASGILFGHHIANQMPDCIAIPQQVSPQDLVRWKLSREVFRDIFISKSDHIKNLDDRTRAYLSRWRSEATTECDCFRPPQLVVSREDERKSSQNENKLKMGHKCQ